MTATLADVGTFNVAAKLLGGRPYHIERLRDYLAVGGYATTLTPAELLERIDATGLRGRGGAGFPLATKLRAVREQGGTPVVVANGEESEPGSIKDRHLMCTRPHLILDGLAHAAAIVGAERGYVYLSDPASAESIRQALTENPQPITVVEVAPTYVAGEETAVVRFLDGGPALPVAKPPRPYERGVGGAPTLISNVETLAHVSLLAAGTDATGHLLVTMSERDRLAVLFETSVDSKLGDLLAADAHAALIGGMFGGLIATNSADRQRLGDFGHGTIYVLRPDDCPVDVAADALAYLSAESSRQCGVCISGTRSLADAVAALRTVGTASDGHLANISRWSAELPGRGACGLLDAAARIAGSLARNFEPLVARHVTGMCTACSSSSLEAAGNRFNARRTP